MRNLKCTKFICQQISNIFSALLLHNKMIDPNNTNNNRFYTLSTFATTSNPLNTQASAAGGGADTLNVTTGTAEGQKVNVSTGVVETPIASALTTDFPLAIYSVDKVLLPYDLFGPKSPASAPLPAADGKPGKGPKSTAGSAESAGESSSAPESNFSGWRAFFLGAGLVISAIGSAFC